MKMPLIAAAVVMSAMALVVVTSLPAQRAGGAAAPRIPAVVVDMATVTLKSARLKESMESLKKEYETEAATLKKESDEGNRRTAEYQKMAPGDPNRAKAEEELHRLRTSFELHGKRVNDRIRESETKVFQTMQREIREELGAFAEANDVDLVLRYEPPTNELNDPRAILAEIHKPIVYQRGGDITTLLLEGLNRRVTTAARPAAPGVPARPVQR